MRKVRSDRKRDIKPVVSFELRETIYSLSYNAGMPVKDVVEKILIHGSESREVIQHLAQHFLRDIKISNTVYMGNPNRTPIKKRKYCERVERVSTRIDQHMHDGIAALAYSMDCSASKACTVLIEATIEYGGFVSEFKRLNRRK